MINGLPNNYNINGELLVQPQSDVRITKLLMVVTRDDYRTPYRRSFDIDAGYGNISRFQETILRSKGFNGELTPLDISSSIPGCIKLQSRPIAGAQIINGWNNRRLRFLMEVVNNFNGSQLISYFQGYTEYYDASIGGNIDPNMKFYINSVLLVRKSYDSVNNRYYTVPAASYNVLTNWKGETSYQMDFEGPVGMPIEERLIRPTDIMNNLINSNVNNDNFINTTGTLSNSLQTSKRTNNDPMEYLTTTLNGYTTSMNVSSQTTDPNDIYRNAPKTSFGVEASIYSLPFMYALTGRTGNYSPTSFTLNDLISIDPNCNNDRVMTLVVNDNIPLTQNINPIINGSDTQDTLNPNLETMIASSVNNAITSIMLKNMVTRLAVSFGNRSGENDVFISDINSFVTDMDITFYGNRVAANIKEIMMSSITMGNQLVVEISVYCDILRDCSIVVDVGSGPVLFRFPTFADSLYIPVVANSATSNDIIGGVESFISAVTNAIF